MSDWIQLGKNFVRHEAGGIYVSAKGGGKKIRLALGTKSSEDRKTDARSYTQRNMQSLCLTVKLYCPLKKLQK
jgi:hypothetical protein